MKKSINYSFLAGFLALAVVFGLPSQKAYAQVGAGGAVSDSCHKEFTCYAPSTFDFTQYDYPRQIVLLARLYCEYKRARPVCDNQAHDVIGLTAELELILKAYTKGCRRSSLTPPCVPNIVPM